MNITIPKPKTVEVALPLPMQSTYTYSLPKNSLDIDILIGKRVAVTFRNKKITGIIVDLTSTYDPKKDITKIKPIDSLLDDEPLVTQSQIKLATWISEYYLCSVGEVLSTMLPKLIRMGRAATATTDTQHVKKNKSQSTKVKLSDAQAEAVKKITEQIEDNQHDAFLLHGVTGSGKTEVYMASMEKCLAQGKSVINLVPEIALTHQMREWYHERFGSELAILHSQLTDKERYDIWLKVRARKHRVVLGPRSAIFAPVPNLGLIVIDEEHESTYKQQEVPRYHTRDVALQLARIEQCVLIMGSATPSIETMYAAQKKEITYLTLPDRVTGQKMPDVKVLDLKNYAGKSGNTILSPPLRLEIEKNLNEKKTVLLFINRRGFASYVSCLDCGTLLSCSKCAVALTYHQKEKQMLCHYCNFAMSKPDRCRKCGKDKLRFGGTGTEKVQNEIHKFFPAVISDRLDKDSTKKKGSMGEIIKKFRRGQIQILIGTQMVAKGFDFDNLTLVGVISADQLLSLPDFRASEKAFQLITQVAGRPGRKTNSGRVVIQTFSPDHYSVVNAKAHDYLLFYSQELKHRKEFGYPPFSKIINIIVRSRGEDRAQKACERLAAQLRDRTSSTEVDILGPAKLPFYKLHGSFRWHVMVKGPDIVMLQQVVKQVLSDKGFPPSGVKILPDVDPSNIL